jgi:hypothetical protein
MTKRAGNPTDFESFLTWEALTDVLSYDPAAGEFRWVKSGRPGWVGRVAGHVDPQHGYRTVRIEGRKYFCSRLAWLHETKQWPAGVIDHINGKRDDDRWENLRDILAAENALNKSLNHNNATGVPGVYWDAERQRYVARIAKGRQRISLGAFVTIEEAAAARKKAEAEHYGEFGRADAAPKAEAAVPRVRLRKDVSSDMHSGLNQTMLARIVSYDPATGDFRWLETSNGEVKIGPIAGRTNKRGYRQLGIGGRLFYAHRLAWLYVTGKWPAAMVDHKDGNPSNNAWSNLRAATAAQNNANRIATPGKSGITGVFWHAARRKWTARVSHHGRFLYLGIFETIEEAKHAREAWDKANRGGFTRAQDTDGDVQAQDVHAQEQEK